MSATLLTIYDETVSGEKSRAFDLEFETSTITARELIRKRIYEEVREHNLKQNEFFHGLVQPEDAEILLNGYNSHKRHKVDWQQQVQSAEIAFERNEFFILVDDRQIENLDDEIDIRLKTEVSFVKLVQLVGG